MMRIVIDASNIQGGGGTTHLVELLRAADPMRHGIDLVVVWGNGRTLARIEERPWLEKRTSPTLERNLFHRVVWQRFSFGKLVARDRGDLAFLPGGSILTSARPVVTMSRNMLPFQWRELRRFGFSLIAFKLLMLRWLQGVSLRGADGAIFLTTYARETVTGVIGKLQGVAVTIPHGVDERFRMRPRHQRDLADVSWDNPLRVVYISVIDVYKHQWSVIDAIGQLRARGLPIRLDLYGPARRSVLPRLEAAIQRVDPEGDFVRYWGPVDHAQVHDCYRDAEIAVFASSCENMPNILVECMASGLPIACSDLGPMPEILGDAGEYFDPESPDSIAAALERLGRDPAHRERLAARAYHAAQSYSWIRCADETFAFFRVLLAQTRQNA